MRVKFTIAVCALLVLGLAVSQVNAQGYKVSLRTNNVVMGGNNQELGAIRLTFKTVDQGGFNIVRNDTIEITFGDLTITNAASVAAANLEAAPTDFTAIGNVTVSAKNDDDTNVGKVTLNFSGATPLGSQIVTLAGIRADVSGLEDGDTILATISATGSGDGFSDITETAGASAAGRVSTVKDGINVTAVGQVSVLTCDAATTAARRPSIKVEEGFNAAWETDGIGTSDTNIRIVVANVPTGVTFRWPGQGNVDEAGEAITEGDDFFANPMDLRDRDDNDDSDTSPDTAVAMLMYESAGAKLGDDTTKHFAVYSFQGTAADVVADAKQHDELKNVFTISPMVSVDTDKTGMGGVSDVWAQLWPEKGTEDVATKLSYATPVETKDEGYFVNVAECVTYLLFPYITCGAHADWDTGIAIANTTMDDGIFGISKGATAQTGSVTIYAYPTGAKTADYSTAEGYTGKPSVSMISGGLAGGDSIAMNCGGNPMLAGMQGYAIVKAGFRHAHGMAFVTNSASGAVDAVHGYVALVIPDPEFGGENEDRAAAEGEVLGH
jgi:hypothetical protein